MLNLDDLLDLNELLFNHSDDMISIHNAKGDIFKVSPSCKKILGYEPAQLTGKNAINFHHPDDCEKVKSEIESQILNQSPSPIIYRAKHITGRYKWLETTWKIVQTASDQEHLIITYTKDIDHYLTYTETLKNSKQNLQNAMSLANMGTFEFLKGEGYQFCEQLCDIFGMQFTGEPIPEEHFLSLIPKEDLEKVRAELPDIEHIAASTLVFTHRVKTCSGIKWLKVKADAIVNESGEIIKGSGIMMDITRDKIMQEELIEKTNVLTNAQKLARFCNIRINLNTKKITGSSLFYEFVGLNEDQILTITDFEKLIHPNDIDDYLKKSYESSINNSKLDTYYRLTNKKTGQILHVHDQGYFNYDADGKPIEYLGTLQDITLQQKISDELINSRNSLKAILESLPGIVFSYHSATGTYEFLNDFITSITGYTKDELTINSYQMLIEKDGFDSLEEERKKAYLKNENYEATYRLKTKSGKIRWLYENGINLKKNNQNFHNAEFQGVIIDITDRVTAEDKIVRSVLATEEKERNRISKELHDGIQQILLAAKLNIESANKECDSLSEKGKQRVLKGMNLLDLGLSEIRQLSHAIMPKSLSEKGLKETIINVIDHLSDDMEVALNLDALDSLHFPMEIQLDIFRVVQEAFSNIIKHSSATKVKVSFLVLSDFYSLIIEDNGKGFEEYDQSNKKFGLDSMKTRATALKGQVEIISSPNKGAIVKLLIPVNP